VRVRWRSLSRIGSGRSGAGGGLGCGRRSSRCTIAVDTLGFSGDIRSVGKGEEEVG